MNEEELTLNGLNNRVNQMYDEQLNLQKNIIDTGTQQTISELEKQKAETQEAVDKTNKALYTDYQKQINPYGVNAENLAANGLANSGLAESTKANYYNTYQNARTEATNNANKIKANFDMEMAKAKQTGDLQYAQAQYDLYTQRIKNLYDQYNLQFQNSQFEYQKGRDVVSDNRWQQEYDLNKQAQDWQQQYNKDMFEYQKQQDKQAQANWEKEYELSKKKATASSSRKSSGGTTYSTQASLDTSNNTNSSNTDKKDLTPQEIIKNAKVIQGTGTAKENTIKDGISGKSFKDMDALLKYYGYAAID